MYSRIKFILPKLERWDAHCWWNHPKWRNSKPEFSLYVNAKLELKIIPNLLRDFYLEDILSTSAPTTFPPVSAPTSLGFASDWSREIERETQECPTGMRLTILGDRRGPVSPILAAPSTVTIKKNRGSPISAARYHVDSHAGTLHDKLAKIVVRCAADFMTRRQNLHYKIASQQKLKTDK